jgi:hypothetical protein
LYLFSVLHEKGSENGVWGSYAAPYPIFSFFLMFTDSSIRLGGIATPKKREAEIGMRGAAAPAPTHTYFRDISLSGNQQN